MNPKIGTSMRTVNSTGMYYKSYIVYMAINYNTDKEKKGTYAT